MKSNIRDSKEENMELREKLELVDVEYDGKKAIMTFLDKERSEVRIVNFNKQSYDESSSKFVDDPEKEAKVEEWCKTYFDTSFDDLQSKIGSEHDVYVYEKFNSLWECQQIVKFRAEQLGEIYQTSIKEIVQDNFSIRIRYDIDGDIYESKMTYGEYVEAMKQRFVDPQKKATVLEKFKKKFGVPVEKKDDLIGMDLIVEVKCAFKKFYYGDIKPFPTKK